MPDPNMIFKIKAGINPINALRLDKTELNRVMKLPTCILFCPPLLLKALDKKSEWFLVQRALEDESDTAGVSAQWLDAERAGGVEGVRAVRQRDLTPVRRRLL